MFYKLVFFVLLQAVLVGCQQSSDAVESLNPRFQMETKSVWCFKSPIISSVKTAYVKNCIW